MRYNPFRTVSRNDSIFSALANIVDITKGTHSPIHPHPLPPPDLSLPSLDSSNYSIIYVSGDEWFMQLAEHKDWRLSRRTRRRAEGRGETRSRGGGGKGMDGPPKGGLDENGSNEHITQNLYPSGGKKASREGRNDFFSACTWGFRLCMCLCFPGVYIHFLGEKIPLSLREKIVFEF